MHNGIPAQTARPHTPAERSRRARWTRLGRVASVLFFGVVAALFASTFSAIDWPAVGDALDAYQGTTLAAAGLFAVVGHALAASYDVIGRRHAGTDLPASRSFAINFIAYTFSTNLGALVGGWALRMRLYTRHALHARQVFRIIVFSIVTNWSGFVLLGGIVLMMWPPQFPQWSPAPAAARAVGAIMLMLVAAYLWLCVAGSPRRWLPRLRALSLDPPQPRTAMLQLALSSSSWLLIAATLAQLLPQELPFAQVLAMLLLASVIGAATHVPGNLGVLEASVLLSVGGSQAATLAALIVFRAIYYFIPLTIAATAYVALEWAARRSVQARRLPS